MSQSRRQLVAKPSYFAECRNYENAIAVEVAFFKGLLDAKDYIKGMLSNRSLQVACKEVASFLQDHGRPLDILVDFSVTDPRSSAVHTLFLGTQLNPPKKDCHAQVTHFLCLTDDNSILVKIHLDLDFHADASEKKPSPHVQIGGRAFPALFNKNASNKQTICWNEQLDKPRMPSLPTCTALLWHWAFLEYQGNEQVSDFLDTWHWKRLVQKAEESVLAPYFADASRLLQQKPAHGFFNALYFPLSK